MTFNIHIICFDFPNLNIMGCQVESLSELAAKTSVREANLLRKHAATIPPCLYECLLLTAVTTNRVLSIRSLMLSWPLQELCLANCKEFTPEHASMIAHCLQEGCNKLRVINLSGCNTGTEGTNLFLKLANGQRLPTARTYGVSGGQDALTTDHVQPSAAIQLQADCYIDNENYHLFLSALRNKATLGLNVSCLHAEELGFKRIKKLLKRMAKKLTRVDLLVGLKFAMNSLPPVLELDAASTFTQKSPDGTNFPNSVPSQCAYFKAFNCFSNLKYLNLSCNPIGSYTTYVILRDLSEKCQLTHLLLNSCRLGLKYHYIDRISELKCIEKLEHLELENNRLKHNMEGLMKLLIQCSSTLVYL